MKKVFKKKTIKKKDIYRKRFARHFEELRWLYTELYGNNCATIWRDFTGRGARR